MSSREWRCGWSSADRRCSNYIWVIDNFIAYLGVTYIRGFTVYAVVFLLHFCTFCILCFGGGSCSCSSHSAFSYVLWRLCRTVSSSVCSCILPFVLVSIPLVFHLVGVGFFICPCWCLLLFSFGQSPLAWFIVPSTSEGSIGSVIFSCDQAALQMVFSVCPSVRPSVRLSVTPFWLCSHHRIIMKLSEVITNDQSKVHAKVQGQRSKVKVTEVTTQLNRFRTVTPVWIHIWWCNDAYSLMLLRRGALLFFKVIRQISRSHGSKNRQIWPRLGVSGL